MCGIAGVARFGGHTLGPEFDDLMAELAGILHHRGPDERKLLRDGPIGLAFTRLSLVDPQGGGQPLVSADGNVVLVANGEVYNHAALAARLPAGVKLRTGSDCEVLLHLYQLYGLEFLRDVRGMFGIILWDRAREQLVLARDRFGIKPLYYHRDDTRIIMSSEIKGLFADPATPRRFAWERALAVPALSAAVRFSAPDVCTWFEGVESVPAATALRIDLRTGRTHRHRYWELPAESDEPAEPESLIERYGDLLEESVRECATADTELGLFLSGGIDSAAVLALARAQLPEIHTFTALTGGTRANGDAENAHWLARELKATNHQVVFTAADVPTPEEWLRLVWLAETPMVGPEIYYKHELHRFARNERPGLRGMLLGAASDEFNGGYSSDMGSDWDAFIHQLRGMARNTRLDEQPGLRPWWANGESLFSDEVLNGGVRASTAEIYRTYLESQYRKVQQYNVWHEDRTAAGSGIEARVPFLDHRLVELTATMPDRLKPRLLWDKRILRDAMRSRLPRRIAERPKVPFFYGPGTRYAYRMLVGVLRANGRELVERALAAPEADAYLDGDAINRRLAELGTGDTDAASVELLMRVVNMGLLAGLVARPGRIEELSAGPVRTALPYELDPVADTDRMLTPVRSFNDQHIPAPAKGMLLLSGPAGSWYLVNDGQVEFELEQDTPILRLLRGMDGESTLASVLESAGVGLDEVGADLEVLLDQQLISLDG